MAGNLLIAKEPLVCQEGHCCMELVQLLFLSYKRRQPVAFLVPVLSVGLFVITLNQVLVFLYLKSAVQYL